MSSSSTLAVDAQPSDPLQAQPIERVERDGTHYTLLGTAHVSQASVVAAKHIAADTSFDAVAVELDPARYQALLNPDAFQNLDLFKVIKEDRVGAVAANLALAAYQRRLAEQLGVEPGAELKAACEVAVERGKQPWLIDRAVGLTLKRASAGLGFWARFEMLSGIIAALITREEVSEKDVEALKQGDILQATFSEFARSSPALYEGLISERDQYMAAQLRAHAATQGAQRVVAVVGAGHLQGLAKALAESQEVPQAAIERLEQPPTPSLWPKWFGYGLIAFLLLGFAYGFSRGFDVGRDLVLVYLGLTASGALLGGLIAGAHPLSALAGAFSAPLTVLHPALAAGMFSAGVELWKRRPVVRDFQLLRDDVRTWTGWWRNGVTRVLLIFMLTNIGTSIGVWITGFEVVRRLSAG